MNFINYMTDYNPWQEMEQIQREVNRIFEGVPMRGRTVFPMVNIWTDTNMAVLTAELPGVTSENIHLSVMENNLTIEGKRERETLAQNSVLHRQERRFGDFKRSIRLPFAVEADKIEAKFNNGCLIVNLPRAEEDKPRKITIKAS